MYIQIFRYVFPNNSMCVSKFNIISKYVYYSYLNLYFKDITVVVYEYIEVCVSKYMYNQYFSVCFQIFQFLFLNIIHVFQLVFRRISVCVSNVFPFSNVSVYISRKISLCTHVSNILLFLKIFQCITVLYFSLCFQI